MGEESGAQARAVSRRSFIVAGAALTAALVDLRSALAGSGLLEKAEAAEPDVTRDTVNGVVAFICPGPDDYSVAQGQATKAPGGIAAGATQGLIDTLDAAAPPLPTTAVVATLFNNTALQVNPAAASGTFLSPFARLRVAEKAEVFRRIESDPTIGPTLLGYVMRAVPTLVGFLCYSEEGVFDPSTRTVTSRPVGWDLMNYGGIHEGENDFLGYWRGVTATQTSPQYKSKKGG